jgi:hypothetical protein
MICGDVRGMATMVMCDNVWKDDILQWSFPSSWIGHGCVYIAMGHAHASHMLDSFLWHSLQDGD